MRFPDALWKPVASYSAGRRSSYPVRALVWHSAVGPAQAVYERFRNPANGASTHALVLKDGSGWQFVDTRDTAWANGELNRWGGPDPRVPWLAGVYHPVAGTGGPNWSTGSAELEGGLDPYTEPLTGPQYITMVEWTAAFLTHWKLGPPIRHVNLLEHNQISATACPSGRVPWERLIPDTLDAMEIDEMTNEEKQKLDDAYVMAQQGRDRSAENEEKLNGLIPIVGALGKRIAEGGKALLGG